MDENFWLQTLNSSTGKKNIFNINDKFKFRLIIILLKNYLNFIIIEFYWTKLFCPILSYAYIK